MFKKMVAGLIVMAMSLNGFAAQTLELNNFKDCDEGYRWLYVDTVKNGLKEHTINDTKYFFKNDKVLHFVGQACYEGQGKIVVESLEEFNARQPKEAALKSKEERSSESWSMWWAVAGLVLLGGALAATSKGSSGGCANTWDTAKDGSNCGGRAASVRPGGR
jgi:hypothetical protein